MNLLARAAMCLLAAFALPGQDTSSSTLQGSVRDSQGRSVNAAKVQLKIDSQTLSVETDSEGRYRFLALPAGTYLLHADAAGVESEVGPFVLGRQETRKIDIMLGSTEKPQFFDPPSFIVAGVTDSANRGGHGSDPILHSTEALAKATASLGARQSASAGEKQEDALEAVRTYQRAAELDPSESHLFDWGAELLTHRAGEQAVEVFSRGNRLFPRSTRMLLGLAVAWYSRGAYDRAERFFFAAADLNPGDPTPYMFLGQARNSSIGQSGGFVERMDRFARLQPENPWANYYYAVSLRRRTSGPEDAATPGKAESLLEKAVRLDPRMGAAWLELGILFADRKNFPKAISAWQSALASSPLRSDATVIEAHYRLSQAYTRTGDPAKARSEIELYEHLSKQSMLDEESERTRIREFVFTLREQTHP